VLSTTQDGHPFTAVYIEMCKKHIYRQIGRVNAWGQGWLSRPPTLPRMPVLSSNCLNLPRLPKLAGAGALCLALSSVSAQPLPARELVCQMRYGSDTYLLRQAASADPYAAAAMDAPGRFRLRAVVLGTPEHIEHVTLTSYQLDDDAPPLILHQVRLDGPFAAQRAVPDLTGWQYVYDQHLGREMRFGCALLPSPGHTPDMAEVPR